MAENTITSRYRNIVLVGPEDVGPMSLRHMVATKVEDVCKSRAEHIDRCLWELLTAGFGLHDLMYSHTYETSGPFPDSIVWGELHVLDQYLAYRLIQRYAVSQTSAESWVEAIRYTANIDLAMKIRGVRPPLAH